MTGPPFRHVVRAKLVPARIPEGLVTRDRLLRQFSIDHRFTLVSAMPGYGKTAAVRQWIDSVKIPVAWLSLDLLDNDPVSFWSNVLLALGSAVPGIEAEPGMLLWERGVEDGLFLSALVAGLAEAEGPIVLVLDGLAADLDRATVAGLAVLVERAGDTVPRGGDDSYGPTAPAGALAFLRMAERHSRGLVAADRRGGARHRAACRHLDP